MNERQMVWSNQVHRHPGSRLRASDLYLYHPTVCVRQSTGWYFRLLSYPLSLTPLLFASFSLHHCFRPIALLPTYFLAPSSNLPSLPHLFLPPCSHSEPFYLCMSLFPLSLPPAPKHRSEITVLFATKWEGELHCGVWYRW